MKKNLFIILTYVGLAIFLSGCEKDGTIVTMLADPVEPTLVSIPDLTLKRTSGTNVLEFTGTPVDPGFTASATYFLEACVKGNNFKDPVIIYSGTQCKSIKITVSDLNGSLLKKFTPDQVTSADFRIRAVLVVDAGTGSLGTGSNPLTYSSVAKNVNVTPYGLPRLDLIDSGITQKIESALGDGRYLGFVKLDASKPFKLKDPDANITYGADGSALKVDGTSLSVSAGGWYRMSADTKNLTWTMEPYMIGLVGSATPNDWGSPDQKMDYNPATGTWDITITLKTGEFKFRLNDGWAWNLGGTPEKLEHNGANCPVTAGNYTIKLTITVDAPVGTEAGTYTIKKN